MIQVFNAFQAVAMFAAMPFGLAWLSDATFKGAGIAFWVGCVVYLVSFLLNVFAVTIAIDRTN